MELALSGYKRSPIRVLIVSDFVILRQGIRSMLNKDNDVKVVGEAETEYAALSLTKEVQPDIILLDNLIGATKGLVVARQLLSYDPDLRIVLFSASNDEQHLFEALRIGVYGYLQATMSIDNVRRALRAVSRGERFLGDDHAITQIAMEFRRLKLEQSRLYYGLCASDVEIVRLISAGWTNKEIGEKLFLSEVQVKRKLQQIYRKLNVFDRTQAVAEFMRQGLI